MRLLVFGSRHWDDYFLLGMYIHGFDAAYQQLTIIEGEADGADQLARRYYERNRREGLVLDPYPAKWKDHDPDWCTPGCKDGTHRFCYGAGPKRNQRQLDTGEPDCAIGAKDGFDYTLKKGGGTEDMYKRLIKACVPTLLISHGPLPRPQPKLDI
jgi:hypothetical protein